jgi:GNAT superfamily N-acetyltransferase
MNLYNEYLKERLGDNLFVDPENRGFATYRYLNENKTVYIVDIFVLPDFRRTGLASRIADSICEIAKKQGAKELIGTVSPKAKNPTDSLKVLLGYGMTLINSQADMIVFRKDI